METLKRLPFQARKSVFQKLEQIVDIASLSKEERELYDESIKVYRDNLAVRAYAVAEGRAEGRAEGLAEGCAEGEHMRNRQIVCEMAKRGFDMDMIASITNLTAEDIRTMLDAD